MLLCIFWLVLRTLYPDTHRNRLTEKTSERLKFFYFFPAGNPCWQFWTELPKYAGITSKVKVKWILASGIAVPR